MVWVSLHTIHGSHGRMTVRCILSMTQDAGVQIAKDSGQSYDGCPCEPEVSLHSFYTARYDYGER